MDRDDWDMHSGTGKASTGAQTTVKRLVRLQGLKVAERLRADWSGSIDFGFRAIQSATATASAGPLPLNLLHATTFHSSTTSRPNRSGTLPRFCDFVHSTRMIVQLSVDEAVLGSIAEQVGAANIRLCPRPSLKRRCVPHESHRD